MRIYITRTARDDLFFPCLVTLKERFSPEQWLIIDPKGKEFSSTILPPDKTSVLSGDGTSLDQRTLRNLVAPPPARDDIVVIVLNNYLGNSYSEILRFFRDRCRILIFTRDFQLLSPGRWFLFRILHPRLAAFILSLINFFPFLFKLPGLLYKVISHNRLIP